MQLPDDPSIVVLLVATDGARWIPEVLRGLRAQQHRPLQILAVDNASTDGSAAMLEKSIGVRRVITLERRVGYGRALAAALKVAAERNLEADAILLLHDDCALAPGAIAQMVSQLRGPGVGIVGAKLLEWDDPSMLQDIGQTTDRYGRTVARVERGELDQGQHDGVHDVLFATSAALLVGREVVERVGLFDMRFVAMRDDLDLCWRARLAGFRTVVTSDASARHVSAVARDLRESPVKRRTRYFRDRNMIAALIKNYSLAHLAIALPLTIVVSFLNAVLFVVRGRRDSALQVLEALQWNIVHLPSTLRARVRAQHGRTAHDAEITALMHHGATRLRSQIESAMEKVVGEVDTGSEDDLFKPPPTLRQRLAAHPAAMATLIALVLAIGASRTLFGSAMLAGRDMPPFPGGAGAFFTAFGSGWRGAGAGGAGPATPALAIFGLLSTLSFGSAWLAQRVLLLGLPLIGIAGMMRTARALELSPQARRVAVVAYAASPALLGAFGAGRLPDLALLSFAPLLMLPLLRAVWIAPDTGWRATAAGIAGLAIAAALSPYALALVAGVGLVLGVVTAIGPKPVVVPVLRRTGLMIAGALALLFPWSAELFRPGSPIGGGGRDGIVRMADLLGQHAGAVAVVPLVVSFGIVLAAVAGALAPPERRRRSSAMLGAVAVASVAAAWAVARGAPWIAPRPSLPLAAAAIAFSLLAAFAYDAARPRLTARHFGAPHLIATIVGVLFVVQAGAAAVWLVRGIHPGIVDAGGLVPPAIAGAPTAGSYRLAWVGGTAQSPAVALSGTQGIDATAYLARPGDPAATALAHAFAQIANGSTEAGGRLLATFGVRVVVVRPNADAALARSIARQVDLAFAERLPGGATVYENQVALSQAAAVQAPGWIAASGGSLDAAAGAESTTNAGPGLTQTPPGTYRGSVSPAGSTVVLAEDYSGGWRLSQNGRSVAPSRSFGWATKFRAPAAGSIKIEWGGQRWHRAALLLEALIVAAFGIGWSQRAARERGER